MNKKERFLNALNLKEIDRPPVAAVATGITVDMQEKCGIFWPKAHKTVDDLAGLAESIYLYTDTECVKLPFDMAVEVEALGGEVDYRTIDTTPTESGHLWNHPDELVIPEDVFDRGRIPVVLEATNKLRKKYDDEIAVVTSIVGPFGLAAKLFGFNNFLMWIITNPDWVHQIMGELTQLAIDYCVAQAEAGADAIILGEATCTGDLISSETYRDFIMPYHSKLCPAVPVPDIMHICGKSGGHIPYIIQTGTACYNFDEGIDLYEAVDLMKGKICIAGSVPTLSVLLNGTPEETYDYSVKCLEAGVDMLTPGCAMAPHTPIDNINAMARAAIEWKK
jgi:[methyl-Co(III) methanol-specific corrinoid protein]:coenzyme M methyltransferase